MQHLIKVVQHELVFFSTANTLIVYGNHPFLIYYRYRNKRYGGFIILKALS